MYKAKKIVQIIVDDIKANLSTDYDFNVYNLYGKKIENIDNFFTQTNAIYVVFQGDRYNVLTQHGLEGDIQIMLVIIDQIIGTQDKESYFIDDAMDFLTWKDFTGLATEYPDDDFRPFFPAELNLFVYDEKKGRAMWTITGSIGYDKHDIGR